MWMQRVVRTVALSALATMMGVSTLVGVAGANDMPPPPPAPPHTVQSCVDTYTKSVATIFNLFTDNVNVALGQAVPISQKVLNILNLLGLAQSALDQAVADAVACGATATGGPVVRAASLSAKPKHDHGGGANTVAGCVNTFNKAIKNASRAQSRSLKKKHHQASLTTATATFQAAFNTAHDRLVACLNNATS